MLAAAMRITSAMRCVLYMRTMPAAASLSSSGCARLYSSPDMCSARGSYKRCAAVVRPRCHLDRVAGLWRPCRAWRKRGCRARLGARHVFSTASDQVIRTSA
jgi:hypothetical protein